MAELVHQTTLRVAGVMVGMEDAGRRLLMRGCLQPMVVVSVDPSRSKASCRALRRCRRPPGTRRTMRHAVVQAQGLRQQQGQAQGPGAAGGQWKVDHELRVAALSSPAEWR